MNDSMVVLKEDFKTSLMSGDILDEIKKDFAHANVLSKDEYSGFFEWAHKEYANMNFAKIGKYILTIGYGGFLDAGSIANCVTGCEIGDDFYFIIRNMKTDEFEYVESYEGLKALLKNS